MGDAINQAPVSVEQVVRELLQDEDELSEDLLRARNKADAKRLIQAEDQWLAASPLWKFKIDGLLEVPRGFVEAVDRISSTSNEYSDWPAILWGSVMLSIRELLRAKRFAAGEQFLDIMSQMSNSLPSENLSWTPQEELHIHQEVAQALEEFCSGYLRLALFTLHHPHSDIKEVIPPDTISFEVKEEASTRRLRSWCDRLRRYADMSSRGACTRQERPETSSKRIYRPIPVQISEFFQGRDDYLGGIRQGFVQCRDQPAVVSLYGLPGIGKTQLAARYCKEYQVDYDVVLWLKSDTDAKLRESCSNYAVNLSLARADPKGDGTMNCRALMAWLETTDHKWLIVFDNVDDPKVLIDFWPVIGRGNIIVTSRNPYTAESRAREVRFEVAPLDSEDSVLLFYKIIGYDKRSQHSQRMDSLLQDWRGVPLAIDQMGSLIRRRGLNLDKFVEIYSKHTARLLQEGNVYNDYSYSVATTFATQHLDRHGKALLQVMCFLDPDAIPGELIDLGVSRSEGLNGLHEIDYFDGLESLLQRSLIQKVDNTVSVHRLVQQVAYLEMGKETSCKVLDGVLNLLLEAYPRETDGQQMWKDWKMCETYLPHVMFASRRFGEFCPHDKSIYMFERGLHTDAETLLALAQRVCPDDSDSLVVATILFNLAGIRNETNRIPEARDLCLRSLEIRERLLARDDPLLRNTYYSMGIVYMEDNQLDKSLEYNLKSIQIRDTSGNEDAPGMAFAYGNLGLCYRRRGQLDEASQWMEKSEALWRKACGIESDKYAQYVKSGKSTRKSVIKLARLTEGRIAYYLGNLRLDQGRVAEARHFHSVSLNSFSKVAPDHFKTGLCHHKIATFLWREREFDEAVKHLKRAISLLERGFDPKPRLARSTFVLSQVLKEMGHEEEGEQKLAEAEALRRSIITLPTNSADSSPEAFESLIPYFLR
ncbi:hypothetical protein QBC40DRAFT_264763 [Triangularia verruculosa]|uniref:NB-ARC domain-containing protein n=1 Tax=Triangularia verruculosa TaxID=2587418 RepID=A0AAN6XHM4_9PEZI|nr:hypothetical protein QBC40DRAFT_264763 [Triangularia verruculosa]